MVEWKTTGGLNKKLNKNLIYNIMTDLNEVCRKKNKKLIIKIYGGSALCLYDMRDFTQDIDVVVNEKEFYDIEKSIAKIAEKYNLSDDFLNTDVIHTLYDIKRETFKSYNTLSNLEVQLVTKEELFALKLLAFREKDIQDLATLNKELKLQTEKDIYNLIEYYYGARMERTEDLNRRIDNNIKKLKIFLGL